MVPPVPRITTRPGREVLSKGEVAGSKGLVMIENLDKNTVTGQIDRLNQPIKAPF
jgi:hypothetical protein